MPRSSRHKSSKHSSREYSDSEKDSISKDRKANKEEGSARVSKDPGSSEKRKDRGDTVSVNDRWNGGDDVKLEATKKPKEKSSESKSKRRDEREREKEKEKEKERKVKDGKNEKSLDGDETRAAKQVSDKTEFNVLNLLQSSESENQHDRRIRRKRDSSGVAEKHQDDSGYINERGLSSREEATRERKLKDETHKDEKYRDKYREDTDREYRHRESKRRDERSAIDHSSSRSDEKHIREERDAVETRRKKLKPQDGDRDRDFDSGKDQDRDFEREYYQRDRERDRNRDRDKDRDRRGSDQERGEHIHEHDRDKDLDQERDRDRDQDRDRDKDRDVDYDRIHVNDRSVRYKDSRGKKRPDDHDDYNDVKSRGIKTLYPDTEKKLYSSSRGDSDADRGKFQSRQSHVENGSPGKQRASPHTSLYGAMDEHRPLNAEDSKCKDVVIEQRPKATSSREASGFPGDSEKTSTFKSSDRGIKMDDGNTGEWSLERSSSSKVSPKVVADRSPSSTSLERRYMNRPGVRRNLDIEESRRRRSGSIGSREFPYTEQRPTRDLPLDESTPADSSFYGRTSQINSTVFPPPVFRGGVGSPSVLGSVEEDGRVNTAVLRYRRSGDPTLGRGQGNAWRGAQNWSSPLPNGYIPFQHGPPQGGFPAMMPQFPSPHLFGVRPPMDIPYHIPDVDRFSSHLRPVGWQNMIDGSVPSHMHGWDGNNVVFRDESYLYGGHEWDQSRHPVNGRGWDTGADLWKEQNGNSPSTSLKDDSTIPAPVDEVLVEAGQRSQSENNHEGLAAKIIETKPVVASSAKEFSLPLPKTNENTSDPPKIMNSDDVGNCCHAYLSKLDISADLTCSELYSQCMSLLDIERSASGDGDITMLVNLKDGARAVSKSSNTLLNPSLSPASSDSIFQRAMNIYKKQRVCFSGLPIANGRILDVTLPYKAEEDAPVNDVDKVKDPILSCDVEMPDAPISNLDQKAEVVPVDTAQEKSEDATSAPSEEVHVHDHTFDVKLELLDQASAHGTQEKAIQVSTIDKINDGMSCEMVNSEIAQEDCICTDDNVPKAAAILLGNGHNMDVGGIDKMKVNDSHNPSEEEKGFDDANDASCDPSIFSDGTSKAYGTLMPDSNESESIILSRIHHSPESTH